VNCAATNLVTEAIRTLHHYSGKPVIVYPNSGETYDAETKTWHGSSTGKGFHEEAKDWYEAGARLIGGCCRTSPQHIKELAHTFRT
jgi:homocysteine S-methyltransferase